MIWTPEHLRLAEAAIATRDRLRAILPRLPDSVRAEVAAEVDRLRLALKVRPAAQPRQPWSARAAGPPVLAENGSEGVAGS